MAGFLMYMRGLKPTGKFGAAFGSFGWSGEAVGLINTAMQDMKIEVIEDGLRMKYVPDTENLKNVWRWAGVSANVCLKVSTSDPYNLSMNQISEHKMLLTGDSFDHCSEQVHKFFDLTSLVIYDCIEAVESQSCSGLDAAFLIGYCGGKT